MAVVADTAQYSCKIAGEKFEVLSFSADEQMSDLFHLDLLLWSDNPEVDIGAKIRQTAEVTITWGTKKKSYYGIVQNMLQTEAGRIGQVDDEYGHYSVEIVPTLWLLTQKTNCKIFQEMTADAIIAKVLDDRGMAGKYELKLTESYEVREYTVQYRETDFEFLSRLMEEEGIFYFFTHNDEEKMVIGDSTSAYVECAPESEVEYAKGTGVLSTETDYLSSLHYEHSAHVGKVKLKDFNYRETKKTLKVDATAAKHTDLEIYDYHLERYRSDGWGRSLATVTVEAHAALEKTLNASGTWRSAYAGATFTLKKAYRSDLNATWVIISCTHTASQVGSSGTEHQVTLLAIPVDTTFRAVPQTMRPVLSPQTATVVGPPGEEIYMDSSGRAKVQFHWDLDGKWDDNSSCWIRVAYQYAGMNQDTNKKHGFQWHPLIGDEVVVDFLEGDPDKPVIMASVFNATNTPIIKPDELIRNIMLTPYQHRMLFDDKGTAITLNTGGGEVLYMLDKKKKGNQGRGQVVLSTTGKESLVMEDDNDDYGNTLKLSTADNHRLQMVEKGEYRGLQMGTKEGHKLTMHDHKRWVLLNSKEGHYMRLNDKEQEIVIETHDGHYAWISDKEKCIEIGDKDGKHRLTIDFGKKAVSLVSSGNISIGAGGDVSIGAGGKVTISADSDITAYAGAKMNLIADSDMLGYAKKVTFGSDNEIDLLAGTKGTFYAPSELTLFSKKSTMTGTSKATVNSSSNVLVEGPNVTSNGMSSNKVKGLNVSVNGTMVNVKATGLNRISGSMVKIN